MKIPKFKINWRYAIGEFFIVVIGILVAFQLDAWKENQDEARLVNEYLTDIKAGLETDQAFYKRASEYFNSIGKDIQTTRDYLLQDQLSLPKDGQKSIRELTDWYRIYISNTAFEDLNNSGRISLIENKKLRYDIIAYYQYIDFVRVLDIEYNESLNRMKEGLLGKMVYHNHDELIVPENQVDVILNYLDQKQNFMDGYLGHRRVCNQLSSNIVNTIQEAIENP
ncbi:MAG: hypothetical protein AAGB24_16585 [Bacteroidota bacterium]